MGKAARNRAKREEKKQTVRAELNRPDVQKVLYSEINKQLATATERFEYDSVTCILLCLHSTFGFGKVRLKRFLDEYGKRMDELKEHYELSDSEAEWLGREELRRIGVDLDAWANGVATDQKNGGVNNGDQGR